MPDFLLAAISQHHTETARRARILTVLDRLNTALDTEQGSSEGRSLLESNVCQFEIRHNFERIHVEIHCTANQAAAITSYLEEKLGATFDRQSSIAFRCDNWLQDVVIDIWPT